MAIGGGLGGQLGYGDESTYNTEVVVDRFAEFTKENIKPQRVKTDVFGIGRGSMLRSDRTKTRVRGYSGDIEFPVFNKGMGLIYEHMLGSNTVSGSPEKLHTCVMDANGLAGKFMTVQIGRPSIDGTVRVHTYAGGKIMKWELACGMDDFLRLNTSWDFASADVNTALASASYATAQEAFDWGECTITIGGSTFYSKSFKLSNDRKLSADRRFLSNVKKEPLANGITEMIGELEGEYEDLTHYNSSIAGTQAEMVITFTQATIVTGGSLAYRLLITLPKIELLEADPNISGPEIPKLMMPFRVLNDGTNQPITMVARNADAAA